LIQTKRLILRDWKDSDLEAFAKMNADSQVMEYFPSILSREQSDSMLKKMHSLIQKNGYGFWALSLIKTGEFLGFVGLNEVTFSSHFTPAIEIGWRLSFEHWGKGYATEAATASLAYGFETLNLPEIVSFTTTLNMRSRHVMEKIGMHHNEADDFDHPKLEPGHPLRRHVLYRIGQNDWLKSIKKS
jgi:3-dehydroquinate dehydratase/shikimate dehydrogenase